MPSIAKVVAKHALVPDFLKYGTQMLKTPPSPKVIKQNRKLIQELHMVHPALTFSKTFMEKCLLKLRAKTGRVDGLGS